MALAMHPQQGGVVFSRQPFVGAPMQEPNQRTQSPIVTGSSVLALTYKDGVMIMCDTLASYGSLARFKNVQRVRKLNDNCLVAASGEYSDYQYLMDQLENLVDRDFVLDDGHKYSPREIYSYVCRLLYYRRNKFNPLWNTVVVAGWQGDKGMVGIADLQGTHWTSDFVATGMGAHLAIPLLRSHWRADMNFEEAKELLEQCMRVLYYRDCRTINRFNLAVATKDGARVEQPYTLSTNWSYSRFINPLNPNRDVPVQKLADAQGKEDDGDEMKDQEE